MTNLYGEVQTPEKVVLIPVKSTMVKAIGYNPLKEHLHIQFNSGDVYRYPGVSAARAIGILTYESIGKAVNILILKERMFQFTRTKVDDLPGKYEIVYSKNF